MFIIRPPNKISNDVECLVIFLAGSIEMGAAQDWQKIIETELDGIDCVLLNPRRSNWNSEWVQSIDNSQFTDQVTWEMDGIESAGLVIFYFDPKTKSPVSLAELGLVAGLGKKAIVCCPNDFWRKGNVDIISLRYGFQMIESIDDFIIAIKRYIKVVGLKGIK